MKVCGMEGALLAVIIWTICGCFFIGLGIHALFSKKAVTGMSQDSIV